MVISIYWWCWLGDWRDIVIINVYFLFWGNYVVYVCFGWEFDFSVDVLGVIEVEDRVWLVFILSNNKRWIY